jgi:hypothetical protein
MVRHLRRRIMANRRCHQKVDQKQIKICRRHCPSTMHPLRVLITGCIVAMMATK